MLKVKDWPPTDDFGREMPRHYLVSCFNYCICSTCRQIYTATMLLDQLLPVVLRRAESGPHAISDRDRVYNDDQAD
jgi:hypothetical protein